MGKFCYRSTLSIDRFGRFGLHFLSELPHFRGMDGPNHGATMMLVTRTALRAKRTGRTDHHPRGLLSQVCLHLRHRADELPIIAAALRHPRSHYDLMRRVGAQLHIVTGSVAPVGLLHDPRLRIALAGARLFFVGALGLPDLLDLRQRLLQALLALAHYSLLRCPLAGRLFLPWVTHRLNLFAGRLQMLLQTLLTPETVRPSASFDWWHRASRAPKSPTP